MLGCIENSVESMHTDVGCIENSVESMHTDVRV